MNSASFGAKQAHFSFLRLGRVFCEPLGLTPARVDLLRAIASRSGSVEQAKLWRILSVCKSVVSVMVRSVEKLGFLRRSRSLGDRRTFIVELTEAGRVALREIFYQTETCRLFETALVIPFASEDKPLAQWRRALHTFLQVVWKLRAAFGRNLHDPWQWDIDDEQLYYADVPGNPIRIDLQNSWEEDWEAGIPVTRDYSHDPTAPENWRTWRPLVDPMLRKAKRASRRARRP
jgi:DNA-binding MarR family transcriptional regulator